MTLHQLRVFSKVAELQSFTEAAKIFGLTQPSVSSLIQELVDELKYELFERRGMKTSLTPEGAVLARRAQEALAIIDGTHDEIADLHGLKKGRLAVGGSALAATLFLPVAVQRFKKEHAGVEIALLVDRSEALQQKLLDGEIDVAVLGRAPRSRQLAGTVLREEEIGVIAAPGHPLAREKIVTLEALSKQPLIAYRRSTTIRDMVEQRFAEEDLPFVPFLEVNFQWSSRDAIKSVVANGLGVGFTTKSYATSDVKAGRLKLLKVPQLKLKRTMYIATHKNRSDSRLLQEFCRFLTRYAKNYPGDAGPRD